VPLFSSTTEATAAHSIDPVPWVTDVRGGHHRRAEAVAELGQPSQGRGDCQAHVSRCQRVSAGVVAALPKGVLTLGMGAGLAVLLRSPLGGETTVHGVLGVAEELLAAVMGVRGVVVVEELLTEAA